ncbi:MAG: hypothetical protein KC464_20890, partial [Myxococcales bacterium]|nr:hypothetical protein [Myxococcales bacterium]
VTRGSVARTNHFRLPGPGRREPDERAAANSRARLETVESALAAAPGRADHMPAVMASHDSEAGAGLCRHQEALGFRTLSAVIFDCACRTMRYTPDIPCSTPWVEIGFD